LLRRLSQQLEGEASSRLAIRRVRPVDQVWAATGAFPVASVPKPTAKNP